MYHFLDFEKSISVLEGKIEELRNISSKDGLNIGLEVSKLEEQLENKLKKTYSQLTPWDKVKVARHPLRPHPSEIIKNVFTNWQPLAGDRGFKEDNALLGGVAKLGDVPCVVIGIEKGKTVDKRIFHNFGMVRPEGYRKAQRLINFADKFSLPVITLIDTAGAYPGKGAEERGQAEAIASCIKTSLNAKIPIISLVTGEGGSGGAVALATANKVIMLEHSIYSVISPEGCSSILWRSSENNEQAANALKLTAQDLLELKVIDEIIPEPIGAAHRNPETLFNSIFDSLKLNLEQIISLSRNELKSTRNKRFLDF
ncbi:MAG: acetyl-coenzyme A carboxylase carboxyl transferase subunit alpha [Alphaproteobacteria bacterium]|jgi:acetyl-CoA carboxylase carboxyl transferase subunit alpha|nr:acetyl-CoA carboxylase carboxyltransferase subunit alpha [SAR116 cluster bacterium]GIR80027.1 MAG: acetyl-coenzyme A carboxylase carboxyl transferase subunit alpha [Alphaproteobacteria bacterium]|tara:strand:+ start:646 stop:1584 length:939 start_codon:yes stop_codon:yes gene_type:complete